MKGKKKSMEREIEFRAKGLDNLWYYGTKNGSKANPCIMNLSKFWEQVEKGFLDIKTVGQFSECFDEKNKRKVFEGDIYKIGCIIKEVKFINDKFSLVDSDNYEHLYLCHIGCIDSKFLGTLFDNPELVEK